MDIEASEAGWPLEIPALTRFVAGAVAALQNFLYQDRQTLSLRLQSSGTSFYPEATLAPLPSTRLSTAPLQIPAQAVSKWQPQKMAISPSSLRR